MKMIELYFKQSRYFNSKLFFSQFAFVHKLSAEVREWYALLDRVNKTIEEWGKVQLQWLYFRPIFSAKDIIAQMPEEGVMFKVKREFIVIFLYYTVIMKYCNRLSDKLFSFNKVNPPENGLTSDCYLRRDSKLQFMVQQSQLSWNLVFSTLW